MPDFKIGGMENWGLLTFRRELLIYQENFVTAFTKRKMMNVIAHELAHMVCRICNVLMSFNRLYSC
jgi:aminopeptidase N